METRYGLVRVSWSSQHATAHPSVCGYVESHYYSFYLSWTDNARTVCLPSIFRHSITWMDQRCPFLNGLHMVILDHLATLGKHIDGLLGHPGLDYIGISAIQYRHAIIILYFVGAHCTIKSCFDKFSYHIQHALRIYLTKSRSGHGMTWYRLIPSYLYSRLWH